MSTVYDNFVGIVTLPDGNGPLPEKVSLSGTLLGVLRRPIAGATVKLGNMAQATNAEGKFLFSNIEPMSYTVNASSRFYETFEEVLDLTSAGTTYEIEIVLSLSKLIVFGSVASAIIGVSAGAAVTLTKRGVKKHA